ncbi:MAG TPA: carbohydrate ABC transporter permease [Chthonomonadaceae bacterium]|nr:carbohydrate ABC transporter permease [Chthonomonadaceae bacterium]
MAAAIYPLLALLFVAACYCLAGAAIVLATIAIRRPRSSIIAIALAAVAVPSGAIYAASKGGIVPMLAVAVACLAAVLATYRVAIVPNLDWQTLKLANEARRQSILHLALVTGSLVFLVPFAWLVVTSLKEDKEMSAFPPVWIPTQQVKVWIDGKEAGKATTDFKGRRVVVAVLQEFETGQRRVRVLSPPDLAGTEFTVYRTALTDIRHFAPVWKSYPDALKFLPPETGHGLLFLLNTLQVSVLSILGTLIASSMVAYGFARLRFPGRDALFVALLATMMLPSAVTMMPVFLIFRYVGWIDSLKPLWVPAFFGAPYYIFLLRQFFLSVPTELEDAAKIDGCGYFTTFWRIMVPQIKPALAALTIMAFMASWNDFRGPLIYISSPEKETLAYALQLFQTSHGSEPALLMAASTMVIVPVILLFFFTQRYFIQGITLTGIKG